MNPTPEDILINLTPQETRVALVAHAAVQELHIERSLERGLVGNIYVGKVVRVLPGMQSAFIDIGLERTAFLHVADLWQRQAIPVPGEAGGDTPAAPALQPIEKLIYEGQTLMVQVLKDPINTKGARLTTQISLAGRMLVHLPQDDHIGISQKIDDVEQRAALRERMVAILAAQAQGSPEGAGLSQGFIVRTNAEDATDAELAEDVAYLRKTWGAIQQRAHHASPPALIYQELSLAQRVLRDLVSDATRSVQIDSRENFDKLLAFAKDYMPRVCDRLQLYRGERPLFETANVDEEIERALGRRVDLKSGGYLIIDQTEAMTTIDVNTGGFVGARNFDDTIYRTNLEATQAIARQLRLRNLGGIIIIDFIDMHNPQHRAAVLDELRRALARDKVKVTVSGFSQLGLVELTRKRTRDSLAHMLLEPCPTCGGLGQVKTARTVAYEILREILREAKQFNPREFRIVAAADVIDLFLEEESQHLASLSDFIGKPVSLQVEPAFSQQQYDIVLT
jgi:ribonuclease G